MDRTAVTQGACLSASRPSGRGFAGGGPARPSVEAATEAVAVLPRAGGGDVGLWVPAARGIAERADEGPLDATALPRQCGVM
jgi:hypothetical protein